MNNNQNTVELIGFELCPFTQRASIIMYEKNIRHIFTSIDLLNKPEWFLKISPLGEIPLLKYDDNIIFKANVICEFLNDEFSLAMYPENNLQKAYQRAWIEFAHGLIMTVFLMSIAPDEESMQQQRQMVRKKLRRLEEEIKHAPFFSGGTFLLVDTAYAPLFMRLKKLNELYPLQLLDDLPKLKVWSTELLQQPSVLASEVEHYDKILKDFLVKKGSYLVSENE